MKIAVNIPIVDKKEISVATSILKTGALTSSANQGGKCVQAFEKSVHSFVKSKYIIAVNSGTAALHVIFLPIHPKVTRKNIEFMARIMRNVVL